MSETPSTLRALLSPLLGRWRHIGRVVVEVLVPLQHLLPPEALVTLVALEGFLVCVDQHVRLQVPLRDRGVGAEVALEAFLPLVSFLVNFQVVSIRERFPALVARQGLLAHVLLLQVLLHVKLSSKGHTT